MVNALGQRMTRSQIRGAILTILGVILAFLGMIEAFVGKSIRPDVAVLSLIAIGFGFKVMKGDKLIP
jgi:multisubunit Na+/H+ antiporter MnhG subunit